MNPEYQPLELVPESKPETTPGITMDMTISEINSLVETPSPVTPKIIQLPEGQLNIQELTTIGQAFDKLNQAGKKVAFVKADGKQFEAFNMLKWDNLPLFKTKEEAHNYLYPPTQEKSFPKAA